MMHDYELHLLINEDILSRNTIRVILIIIMNYNYNYNYVFHFVKISLTLHELSENIKWMKMRYIFHILCALNEDGNLQMKTLRTLLRPFAWSCRTLPRATFCVSTCSEQPYLRLGLRIYRVFRKRGTSRSNL